jgi:transposase-like protein
MRGKKGIPHTDPADPPRRRGNKRRGHGTFANDRPPVAGVVGRESGELQLEVVDNSGAATLQDFVNRTTDPTVTLNTDEWCGYSRVSASGREHQTVCHQPSRREWARDDDGDGIREVHNNTMEGIWTGLRNFLRPFRGVSKWYLAQYVAIFQWAYNLKQVTTEFLRVLMGVRQTTNLPS